MQFYNFLLALMFASAGTALPTADAGHALDKRAVMIAVRCAGGDSSRDFTRDQVKGAVKSAKNHLNSEGRITDPIVMNGAEYPHNYGGNDDQVSIPSECGRKLKVEYPLGKDNELDRVVLAYDKSAKSWIYCLSMTHRGLNDNQFRLCTPT